MIQSCDDCVRDNESHLYDRRIFQRSITLGIFNVDYGAIVVRVYDSRYLSHCIFLNNRVIPFHARAYRTVLNSSSIYVHTRKEYKSKRKIKISYFSIKRKHYFSLEKT